LDQFRDGHGVTPLTFHPNGHRRLQEANDRKRRENEQEAARAASQAARFLYRRNVEESPRVQSNGVAAKDWKGP